MTDNPPAKDPTDGPAEPRIPSPEETLDRIINSVADPIFVKDRRHRWVLLNDAYCRFMGYPREDLIGKSDYDYFPRTEADVFWEKDELVFMSGAENINEEKFTNARGTTQTIITKKTLYTDKNGEKYIVGIIRDVTKIKAIEQELKTERANLELRVNERTQELTSRAKMLETLNEIISSSNQAKNLNDFLGNALTLAIDLIGFDGGAAYIIDEAEGMATLVQSRGLSDEFLNDVRTIRTNTPKYSDAFRYGELLATDDLPSFSPDRTRFGYQSLVIIPIIVEERILGTIHAITKRKYIISKVERNVLTSIGYEIGQAVVKIRQEQALRDSEEKYRLLSESSQDFIFILDSDYMVSYVNRICGQAFGLEPERLIGKNIRVLFPSDEDRQRKVIQKVFKTGESLYVENNTTFPILGKLWLDTWLIPLKDENGKVKSILGISRDITKKKVIEESLKLSEERYRSVVEDQTEIISRFLPNGDFTFVNDVFCRFFGKAKNELIGSKWFPRVHKDDLESVNNKLKEMSASSPVVVVESRVISGGGQERWMQMINRGFFDERGDLLEIQSVGRDITDVKKAEELLKKSEEKYRTLIDTLPPAVMLFQDGKIVFANPASSKIFGQDVLGMDYMDAVPQRLREGVEGDIRAIIGGKIGPPEQFKSRLLRKGGVEFPVEIYVRRITYNYHPALQVVVFDITERIESEEALKESEERYRKLVENMPEGIAIHSMGKLVFVNQAAAKILGEKNPEDVIGSSVLDFVHPNSKATVKERIKKMMTEGVVSPLIEEEFARRDGTPVDVDVVAMPMKYKAEDGILVIFRDITERKKTEKALSESEERYRKVIETTNTGFLIIDLTGRVLTANDEYLRMTGETRIADIVGRSVLEWTAPRDLEKNKKAIQKCVKDGKIRNFEVEYVDGKGKITPIELNATVIELGGSEVIITICRDITQRRANDMALKESEERYRKLVENAPEGILIHSNGVIVFSNQAGAKILGADSPKRLIGREVLSIVHPAFHKLVKKRVNRLYRGSVVAPLVELKFIRVDGSEVEIDVVGMSLNYKGEGGALTIFRDITERKRSEREILAVKRHLETVLDGISESIVVVDRRYHIVSYNKAFQQWVGRSNINCIGKKCFEMIHGWKKPCRKCVVRDVFRTGKPSESIHYHQAKSGRKYHEVTAYPVAGDDGTQEAIYMFRDVTDRESMKEQLRENYEQIVKANVELLKLDKMKAEFLAVASHELRTPLSIIMGYADLLSSDGLGSLNPDQKNKLMRIMSNAEHLNVLVNNILDIAKIDAGELRLKKTSFSPAALIEEVVGDMRQLAQNRNLMILTKIHTRSKVSADRSRIKQVLVNLLENALKFTNAGGKITVKAIEKDGLLTVSVKDTGIGIKKGELENIFQRFYQVDSSIQRRYKGAGLGLAICKRLIELHGGSITAESAVREGTTITFIIPLRG